MPSPSDRLDSLDTPVEVPVGWKRPGSTAAWMDHAGTLLSQRINQERALIAWAVAGLMGCMLSFIHGGSLAVAAGGLLLAIVGLRGVIHAHRVLLKLEVCQQALLVASVRRPLANMVKTEPALAELAKQVQISGVPLLRGDVALLGHPPRVRIISESVASD